MNQTDDHRLLKKDVSRLFLFTFFQIIAKHFNNLDNEKIFFLSLQDLGILFWPNFNRTVSSLFTFLEPDIQSSDQIEFMQMYICNTVISHFWFYLKGRNRRRQELQDHCQSQIVLVANEVRDANHRAIGLGKYSFILPVQIIFLFIFL